MNKEKLFNKDFFKNVAIRVSRISAAMVITMLVIWGVLSSFDYVSPNIQTVNINEQYEQEFKIDPFILAVTQYQKARNSKLPIELAEIQAIHMVDVSKQENIPLPLLVAIVEKESLFNPLAVSFAGATGLGQILHAPNVVIDDQQRFDIRYNLEIACLILHGKIEKNSGNLTKALADYSGGAKNYASSVYENIGRFSMFEIKVNSTSNDETLEVEEVVLDELAKN
jgi:soluble lytic murein transglycosylase-like protein